MTTSANGGGIRHDQQQREIYILELVQKWVVLSQRKSACVTRMVVDLYCHGCIYRCSPDKKGENADDICFKQFSKT